MVFCGILALIQRETLAAATKEREFYRFPCPGSTPRRINFMVDFNGLRSSEIARFRFPPVSKIPNIRHHPKPMHAVEKPLGAASFEDVVSLARDDMAAVDRLISVSLQSDVALVSQVSEYIVMSGGKRLRPMIVLLAARAFGYEGEQHVRAAAIIEFIHTATLLHDDVVDSSSRRRGQDSANTVFGNRPSSIQ